MFKFRFFLTKPLFFAAFLLKFLPSKFLVIRLFFRRSNGLILLFV